MLHKRFRGKSKGESKDNETMKLLLETKKLKKSNDGIKHYLQDTIDKGLETFNPIFNEHKIEFRNLFHSDTKITINTDIEKLEKVFITLFYSIVATLIEREIENPYIELRLMEEKNKVTLWIEDNSKFENEDKIKDIFRNNFYIRNTIYDDFGIYDTIETEEHQETFYIKNTSKYLKFFIEINK